MTQDKLTTRAKELLDKMAALEKETLAYINSIPCEMEAEEQKEYSEGVYDVTNSYFNVVQKVCKIGLEEDLFTHLEKARG